MELHNIADKEGILWIRISLKFLNFLTPENFLVIYLKDKQWGQTFRYFVQKKQME